jgi:hypothetical protein
MALPSVAGEEANSKGGKKTSRISCSLKLIGDDDKLHMLCSREH